MVMGTATRVTSVEVETRVELFRNARLIPSLKPETCLPQTVRVFFCAIGQICRLLIFICGRPPLRNLAPGIERADPSSGLAAGRSDPPQRRAFTKLGKENLGVLGPVIGSFSSLAGEISLSLSNPMFARSA